MAELKTPIFGKNGMFNREGRRVRAVHVLDVEDGGGVLRLYRYDGEPDNSTPHGEGDAYYLHVEAAGYLIPIGYTLHQLAERLGRPEAVRELYGSEEARREAEAAARMAAQGQEAREALERAAQTIQQGGTLENEEITDGNGTARAVVLRLMDVYGVAVPPRTRAWMRDKLAAVTFAPGGRVSGLQYRRMRGGRCSGAVWDYLAQLVEAVRGKSGEGAA